MYVYADLGSTPPGLHLKESDNLLALKVVVRGAGPGDVRLGEVLRPLGSLDGEGNAFLQVGALKRLAWPKAEDPAWSESFDQMVEYARTKGWVGAGDTLQAHCEWREGE